MRPAGVANLVSEAFRLISELSPAGRPGKTANGRLGAAKGRYLETLEPPARLMGTVRSRHSAKRTIAGVSENGGSGFPREPSAERSERNMADPHNIDDPYDLNRFLRGKRIATNKHSWRSSGGRLRTHWMWYIVPQIDGLAFSSMSKRYSIKSVEEVKAYLNHPVIGPRLIECAEATTRVEGRSVDDIFGSPDDMKLRSCYAVRVRVTGRVSVEACSTSTFRATRRQDAPYARRQLGEQVMLRGNGQSSFNRLTTTAANLPLRFTLEKNIMYRLDHCLSKAVTFLILMGCGLLSRGS